MNRLFLTDQELACLLEVDERTLRRMLAGFTPRNIRADKTINLMDAKPVCVSGRRRWRASAVAEVLGITEEQLEAWLK